MKNLKEEEVLKVLEDYGYLVNELSEDYDENEECEFVLYNLYDEDFVIPFRRGSIVEDFKAAYDAFDLDEHVEMWLTAKRNGVRGVPSVLFLVENAQDILSNLCDIVEDLKKI